MMVFMSFLDYYLTKNDINSRQEDSRTETDLRPNGQKKTPADGRMETPYLSNGEVGTPEYRCDPLVGQALVDMMTQWKDCSECMVNMYALHTHPSIDMRIAHMNRMCAHMTAKACCIWKPKKTRSHIGNGKPVGPFAFTLTKSPKDPHTVGDMLTAVRKIMGQKTKPVLKYAWYYEDKGRDDNGDPIHPHIHGMYDTEDGGRIPARQFQRAWPIWDESRPLGSGFVGGFHRVVKSEEAYLDYIAKDGGMGESKGL